MEKMLRTIDQMMLTGITSPTLMADVAALPLSKNTARMDAFAVASPMCPWKLFSDQIIKAHVNPPYSFKSGDGVNFPNYTLVGHMIMMLPMRISLSLA
jgi:hypothetical protein